MSPIFSALPGFLKKLLRSEQPRGFIARAAGLRRSRLPKIVPDAASTSDAAPARPRQGRSCHACASKRRGRGCSLPWPYRHACLASACMGSEPSVADTGDRPTGAATYRRCGVLTAVRGRKSFRCRKRSAGLAPPAQVAERTRSCAADPRTGAAGLAAGPGRARDHRVRPSSERPRRGDCAG